jgi:predicted phosphodiesterase
MITFQGVSAMNNHLFGRVGMKIRAGDGCEELGFPEIMSTPMFYKANSGDKLKLKDNAYRFNVATYSLEVESHFIYTYTYSPNESWTVYRHDLSGESYRQNEYVFNETVYFRVCIRKVDGSLFLGDENIDEILLFEAIPVTTVIKPWIISEAVRVAENVNSIRKTETLAFALLTDTHYVVNGTWNDTIASIRKTHELVHFDGVIHLGDFTDGMVTADVTHQYVTNIINDLKSLDIPVRVVLGNHDSNYFKNNPERFSMKEQCNLYLECDEPRYYTDFKNQKLRFIFLESFDYDEKIKYGYSSECIKWLEHVFEEMNEGWAAVIFSHLPPMTKLQYWVKEIRREEQLISTLKSKNILAWINGHNHADKIDYEPFPVVSLVNAKCEAFIEYKTDGFITPDRKLGEVSQEAWDVMVVNSEEKSMQFIRYGAGENRRI